MTVRALALIALLTAPTSAVAQAPKLKVVMDRSQAVAALRILDKQNAGKAVTPADWSRLFATPGYQRLHEREAAMGKPFTDAEFQTFLTSPQARQAAPQWRAALKQLSKISTRSVAQTAGAYLPPKAELRATIFPMVKPKDNSFVYDLRGDPAMFLYLDDDVSTAEARNTLTHEMHHIGFASACPKASHSKGTPHSALLRKWMGSYGEGLAMLAAAGGPEVHPHADSPTDIRAQWDRSISNFNADLTEQNAFFLKVLDGQAGDEATVGAKMMSYFGEQGPWYTVGWRMAQVIETNLGRERLVGAFCDQGAILATYNEAARMQNRVAMPPLPLWDQTLADRLAER